MLSCASLLLLRFGHLSCFATVLQTKVVDCICMSISIFVLMYVIFCVIYKALYPFKSNRACRAFGIALVLVVLVFSLKR